MKKLLSVQSSSARKGALAVIHAVYKKGIHIQTALEYECTKGTILPHDYALVTELSYGYIRYAIYIDGLIQGYLHKNIALPYPARIVLGLAMYELLFLDSVIPSATVYYTVEAIKKRYSLSLSRLVNAILRSFLRKEERKTIDSSVFISENEKYALEYSLPLYIWELLVTDYGNDAHLYARHFLKRPYSSELEYNPSTIRLFEELNIVKLPKGILWDCCTGVGGKRAYVEAISKHTILASDISLKRLYKQGDYNTFCADASNPPFQKESVDIILADVPCSGLGTLRKRPDIKFHRTKEDIENLLIIQRDILYNIADIVKEGGYIIYVTCSVHKRENEEQINNFLDFHHNFKLCKNILLQPQEDINDIFYGALLQKQSL